MKIPMTSFVLALSLSFAGMAHADKPSADQKGKSAKQSSPSQGGGYFTDARRTIVHDYYARNKKAGGCPPGLAKKGNGCRPPGQAKQWRLGYPLPSDVIYYDIPDQLARELGPVSAGQKIVRVGTDLLLIAIGTAMVVDAIEDLDDVF